MGTSDIQSADYLRFYVSRSVMCSLSLECLAVWSEFVIKWDLCRTFSCLAATEPMGVYGCRRRKLEALES